MRSRKKTKRKFSRANQWAFIYSFATKIKLTKIIFNWLTPFPNMKDTHYHRLLGFTSLLSSTRGTRAPPQTPQQPPIVPRMSLSVPESRFEQFNIREEEVGYWIYAEIPFLPLTWNLLFCDRKLDKPLFLFLPCQYTYIYSDLEILFPSRVQK